MNEIRAEQIEQDLGNSVFWSAERIKVVESVWGEEMHLPGDKDYIATLIKPFGLDQSMSALDLGAGLGGATRVINRSTGAWVTGFEADQVLQRAGLARSIKAGLERKAPIELLDWADLSFDKRYDAVFSREVMYTVRDKESLISAIAKAMKPRGHFLFTDYVLKHSAKPATTVEDWRENEPIRPYPMTVAQASEFLENAKFDVRTVEDISEKHHAMVLGAWDRLTRTLQDMAHDPEISALVIEEGELWQRRMAALESGDLRLYRFYALAPS